MATQTLDGECRAVDALVWVDVGVFEMGLRIKAEMQWQVAYGKGRWVLTSRVLNIWPERLRFHETMPDLQDSREGWELDTEWRNRYFIACLEEMEAAAAEYLRGLNEEA